MFLPLASRHLSWSWCRRRCSTTTSSFFSTSSCFALFPSRRLFFFFPPWSKTTMKEGGKREEEEEEVVKRSKRRNSNNAKMNRKREDNNTSGSTLLETDAQPQDEGKGREGGGAGRKWWRASPQSCMRSSRCAGTTWVNESFPTSPLPLFPLSSFHPYDDDPHSLHFLLTPQLGRCTGNISVIWLARRWVHVRKQMKTREEEWRRRRREAQVKARCSECSTDPPDGSRPPPNPTAITSTSSASTRTKTSTPPHDPHPQTNRPPHDHPHDDEDPRHQRMMKFEQHMRQLVQRQHLSQWAVLHRQLQQFRRCHRWAKRLPVMRMRWTCLPSSSSCGGGGGGGGFVISLQEVPHEVKCRVIALEILKRKIKLFKLLSESKDETITTTTATTIAKTSHPTTVPFSPSYSFSSSSSPLFSAPPPHFFVGREMMHYVSHHPHPPHYSPPPLPPAPARAPSPPVLLSLPSSSSSLPSCGRAIIRLGREEEENENNKERVEEEEEEEEPLLLLPLLSHSIQNVEKLHLQLSSSSSFTNSLAIPPGQKGKDVYRGVTGGFVTLFVQNTELPNTSPPRFPNFYIFGISHSRSTTTRRNAASSTSALSSLLQHHLRFDVPSQQLILRRRRRRRGGGKKDYKEDDPGIPPSPPTPKTVTKSTFSRELESFLLSSHSKGKKSPPHQTVNHTPSPGPDVEEEEEEAFPKTFLWQLYDLNPFDAYRLSILAAPSLMRQEGEKIGLHNDSDGFQLYFLFPFTSGAGAGRTNGFSSSPDSWNNASSIKGGEISDILSLTASTANLFSIREDVMSRGVCAGWSHFFSPFAFTTTMVDLPVSVEGGHSDKKMEKEKEKEAAEAEKGGGGGERSRGMGKNRKIKIRSWRDTTFMPLYQKRIRVTHPLKGDPNVMERQQEHEKEEQEGKEGENAPAGLLVVGGEQTAQDSEATRLSLSPSFSSSSTKTMEKMRKKQKRMEEKRRRKEAIEREEREKKEKLQALLGILEYDKFSLSSAPSTTTSTTVSSTTSGRSHPHKDDEEEKGKEEKERKMNPISVSVSSSSYYATVLAKALGEYSQKRLDVLRQEMSSRQIIQERGSEMTPSNNNHKIIRGSRSNNTISIPPSSCRGGEGISLQKGKGGVETEEEKTDGFPSTAYPISTKKSAKEEGDGGGDVRSSGWKEERSVEHFPTAFPSSSSSCVSLFSTPARSLSLPVWVATMTPPEETWLALTIPSLLPPSSPSPPHSTSELKMEEAEVWRREGKGEKREEGGGRGSASIPTLNQSFIHPSTTTTRSTSNRKNNISSSSLYTSSHCSTSSPPPASFSALPTWWWWRPASPSITSFSSSCGSVPPPSLPPPQSVMIPPSCMEVGMHVLERIILPLLRQPFFLPVRRVCGSSLSTSMSVPLPPFVSPTSFFSSSPSPSSSSSSRIIADDSDGNGDERESQNGKVEEREEEKRRSSFRWNRKSEGGGGLWKVDQLISFFLSHYHRSEQTPFLGGNIYKREKNEHNHHKHPHKVGSVHTRDGDEEMHEEEEQAENIFSALRKEDADAAAGGAGATSSSPLWTSQRCDELLFSPGLFTVIRHPPFIRTAHHRSHRGVNCNNKQHENERGSNQTTLCISADPLNRNESLSSASLCIGDGTVVHEKKYDDDDEGGVLLVHDDEFIQNVLLPMMYSYATQFQDPTPTTLITTPRKEEKKSTTTREKEEKEKEEEDASNASAKKISAEEWEWWSYSRRDAQSVKQHWNNLTTRWGEQLSSSSSDGAFPHPYPLPSPTFVSKSTPGKALHTEEGRRDEMRRTTSSGSNHGGVPPPLPSSTSSHLEHVTELNPTGKSTWWSRPAFLSSSSSSFLFSPPISFCSSLALIKAKEKENMEEEMKKRTTTPRRQPQEDEGKKEEKRKMEEIPYSFPICWRDRWGRRGRRRQDWGCWNTCSPSPPPPPHNNNNNNNNINNIVHNKECPLHVHTDSSLLFSRSSSSSSSSSSPPYFSPWSLQDGQRLPGGGVLSEEEPNRIIYGGILPINGFLLWATTYANACRTNNNNNNNNNSSITDHFCQMPPSLSSAMASSFTSIREREAVMSTKTNEKEQEHRKKRRRDENTTERIREGLPIKDRLRFLHFLASYPDYFDISLGNGKSFLFFF